MFAVIFLFNTKKKHSWLNKIKRLYTKYWRETEKNTQLGHNTANYEKGACAPSIERNDVQRLYIYM